MLNHTNVIATSEANLDWTQHTDWVGDKKGEDQFLTVKNYLWQQITSWSQASERRSDESLDSGRSGKRTRNGDSYPAAAPRLKNM